MPAKGGGSSRNYDIIVWGATGFTGKLVAEYMAKYYSGSGLTWALAGRSRGKLEAVAADVRIIEATNYISSCQRRGLGSVIEV